MTESNALRTQLRGAEDLVMRKLLLLLAICLAFAPAFADEELRFKVSGKFTLSPDGTTTELELFDRPPAVLDEMVRAEVGRWRFEQVIENGVAISIPARFEFFLVGTPDGDEVVINFEEPRYWEPGEDLEVTRTVPPRMPERAARRGVSAAVFVDIRVNAEGRVVDTHVARVGIANGQRLRERALADAINDFSEAAEVSIRQWEFSAPGEGGLVNDRLEITFEMMTGRGPRNVYYQWHEMPPAPWLTENGERLAAEGAAHACSRIRRLPDVAPGA